MRDRIVFFVMGALLATLAYFAGDMSEIEADNEVHEKLIVKQLYVTDSITVCDPEDSDTAVSIRNLKGNAMIMLTARKKGKKDPVSHLLLTATKPGFGHELMPAHSSIEFVDENKHWGLTSGTPIRR